MDMELNWKNEPWAMTHLAITDTVVGRMASKPPQRTARVEQLDGEGAILIVSPPYLGQSHFAFETANEAYEAASRLNR